MYAREVEIRVKKFDMFGGKFRLIGSDEMVKNKGKLVCL